MILINFYIFQKNLNACHNRIKILFFFLKTAVLQHDIPLNTTQNLLWITFSFNDLMFKTNRQKKDFYYKDRLIFGLDDPVANMSIRHVYDA